MISFPISALKRRLIGALNLDWYIVRGGSRTGNKMGKVKILIWLPLLSLLTSCAVVTPLVHYSSQKIGGYSNLGTIKVDVLSDPKLKGTNWFLKFAPPIDSFFRSAIETKIVEDNLFTPSDTAEYELSRKINEFQSATEISAGRLIFGCLGLASYFGSAVLSIAKKDATYFYVGTIATVPLIGSAQLFGLHHVTAVSFCFGVLRRIIPCLHRRPTGTTSSEIGVGSKFSQPEYGDRKPAFDRPAQAGTIYWNEGNHYGGKVASGTYTAILRNANHFYVNEKLLMQR